MRERRVRIPWESCVTIVRSTVFAANLYGAIFASAIALGVTCLTATAKALSVESATLSDTCCATRDTENATRIRVAQAATDQATDAVAAAESAAGGAEKTPEYELPSVVVKNPTKPIVEAPAPKKKAAPEVVEELAPPKPKKNVAVKKAVESMPAPEAAADSGGTATGTGDGGGAAGGAAGGGTGAGVGPAISNGGFNSTRVVEQVGTVEEVTAEQIQRSGARTLDQAIQLMPGVHVRDGGDGVPRLDIRGLRTRNVTLLLDGVPLNATFDGQFDPRAVPVENIARIKVSRGGSSVLYGPGGNAAVIDIITKSAAPGLHTTTDAGIGFGREKDARVTASYGSDAVKTFLSASVYQQDAYHLSDDFKFTTLQPTDRRVNSDREDKSFYGNTEVKFSEDVSWGVSVGYREGEYGKPPSTVNNFTNTGQCRNSGANPALAFNWGPCSEFATGLRFERVDHYDGLSLQTSGRINLGNGLMLRPMAYFNGLDELTNRFDDKDYLKQVLNGAFSEDASTKIYGGGGQVIYKMDDRNLLTVAFDAHREAWDADGFERKSVAVSAKTGPTTCTNITNCRTYLSGICTAQKGTLNNASVVIVSGTASGTCNNAFGTYSTDHDLDVYSVSGEYEAKLTNQLSAVLGLGWAEQRRETTSDSDYTYLAGLRYMLTEDTAIRGNVARKIRFPTLRNLYGRGEGNEDLQTEVTKNYEVGFNQRIAAINGFLSVTAFRIDAENFIKKGDCKDTANSFFCNFDQLRFQGVEANLAFSPFEGLNMQVGYTFLDAKNKAAGLVDIDPTAGVQLVPASDKLDNDPRHRFMAAATYTFGTGTTLIADYQFVAASYAVSRNQVNTLRLADYHLLNLGITQDIAGGSLQLYGRVENVLDENYESSFGFPESGRTFFIGVRSKL